MNLIKQISKYLVRKTIRWAFVISVGLVLGIGSAYSLAFASYIYLDKVHGAVKKPIGKQFD